jgi:LPS-assembly lipoprotein
LLRQSLSALLLAVLFSACGFHLKGYGQLSPALNGLYIRGFQKQESLAAVLHENLLLRGATLADGPDSARLVIEIVQEKFTSRVLAVDASGKALDEELNLSALVRARVPNSTAKGVEQPLELVRQLSFSGDDELGQRNEANLMKYDMRSDMAEQIIRRIEAAE